MLLADDGGSKIEEGKLSLKKGDLWQKVGKRMIANSTRTELPSCEAIDGKKDNITYIVIPVTKLKVRVNIGLLPTLISLKLVPNSKLILTSTCVRTSKPAPMSNQEPTSKCLPTSNLEPTFKAGTKLKEDYRFYVLTT